MSLAKQTRCALVTAIAVCVFWEVQVAARGHQPSAGQELFATATNDELDALVAPIALYPDPLLAQVLGAATYPDQVLDADTYVRANVALPWEALIKGAEERSWDPSVTALVQFSVVLNRLAKNIVWTSTLGEAAAYQRADVMAAIQRMRAKASAAGNLKSGERIRVVQENPDIIVIQPVSSKMVFVPSYNPSTIYGTSVNSPNYSAGDIPASTAISFGLGVAVGGPMRGSSCEWRYAYWRIDWDKRVVHCGSGVYLGNPYWWGGASPRLSDAPRESAGKRMQNERGGAGLPTTRPGPGVAKKNPSDEELRGYPVGESARPAPIPNAFSGTVGGRAERARGNRSLDNPNEQKTSEAQR